MDRISVIIPVYNGEKFIKASALEIMGQSYEGELELILINDGSSDGTHVVLEDLKKESFGSNRSLKVVERENKGICVTRNEGLELATGDYVMFMDQDDHIKADCVEVLYDAAKEKDADLVIGGYDLVDEEGKLLKEYTLEEDNPWSKYWIPTPWGRLYKKSVIDDNVIRFMITKISEDFYFNYVFMSYAKKVCPISYRGYEWVLRKSSESHEHMSQYSEDRNPIIMLSQLLKDIHYPNNMDEDYVAYGMIKHVYWYLYYIARSASKKQLRVAYDTCMEWLDQHFPGYAKNPLIKPWKPNGEFFSIRMIVWLSVRMKQIHVFWLFLSCYAKL